MQIGFIGLGAMGSARARNRAAVGHEARAWNCSGGEVPGVTMVDTPAEVFDADAVLTMLSDDDAIRSVVLDMGLLDRACTGLVHVVASTISVAFAHQLVAAHAEADIGYVSAPVLERLDVAAKGELNILADGDPAAVDLADGRRRAIAALYLAPESALASPLADALRVMVEQGPLGLVIPRRGQDDRYRRRLCGG